MQVESQLSHARAVELLRSSTIDAVVPDTSGFGCSDYLKSLETREATDSANNHQASVQQRPSLCLDESFEACLILCCPLRSEDDLNGFLERLKIKIDAFATSLSYENATHEQPAPVKELVTSVTVEDEDDPEVVIVEEENDTASTPDDRGDTTTSRYVCLLWRKQMHITRTRIRSPATHLYLSASCLLEGTSSTSATPSNAPFHTPSTPNLLAPLASDPSFSWNNTTSSTTSTKTIPILPAARLQKHIPADAMPPPAPTILKSATRTLFQLLPALNARIRCETIGGSPNTKRMLVALDLEVPPSAAALSNGQASTVSVDVDSVELELADGNAEIISGSEVALPMRFNPGNAGTRLYELNLSPLRVRRKLQMLDQQASSGRTAAATAAAAVAHVLSVRLLATVRDTSSQSNGKGPDATVLNEKPANQERRLQIRFRTTLDLTPLHQRFARQIDPQKSRAEVGLKNHRLTLSVKTLPRSDSSSHGTCKWSITLANKTTSARNLQVQALMTHEVVSHQSSAQSHDAHGPALVPATPVLEFRGLGHGATMTRVLEWRTLDASLLGEKAREKEEEQEENRVDEETVVELGRIGGLRVVDLDVDVNDKATRIEAGTRHIDVLTEMLPDIFVTMRR